LGVDLTPHKTCSLDCIYCECGATTRHTAERKEYVPLDRIILELSEVLSRPHKIDYITFSGSGEPTLHSGIGDMIHYLRSTYPIYRLAVLTNGTLFYREDVRDQLRDVDVVKVSIDAASEDVFQRINRPCSGLIFSEMIEGLVRFRKGYSKQFWIEVFLVPGLNDTPEELEKIKTIIGLLKPHRVQINTLDRPGTEDWVVAEEMNKLKQIAAYLNQAQIIAPAVVDSTADSSGEVQRQIVPDSGISERILATISRRPCTVEDLSQLLDLDAQDVRYHLNSLMKSLEIIKEEMPRGTFYMMRL